MILCRVKTVCLFAAAISHTFGWYECADADHDGIGRDERDR